MCRQPGTDRHAPHEQARHHCALPGFDVSSWTGEPNTRIHMGAPRDYSREGKGDWAAPCEPIAETGCPGAWYRTDFVVSVLRYYRRRDEHGGRVENPALTQCTDPLVHESVQALEAFEDMAISEFRKRWLAQVRGD